MFKSQMVSNVHIKFKQTNKQKLKNTTQIKNVIPHPSLYGMTTLFYQNTFLYFCPLIFGFFYKTLLSPVDFFFHLRIAFASEFYSQWSTEITLSISKRTFF